MAIIVTGTPGTGKTTLAKGLAEELGLRYIDVNVLAKESGCISGHDDERDADIIDEIELAKVLDAEIRKDKKVVLDGHLSHFAPPELVDECIVTTCSLGELRDRLEMRGYSEEKIRENLEAEIMHMCEEEAFAAGHKVRIVHTDPKGL